LASVNAVSSSIRPTAATMKKIVGNPAPSTTAAASSSSAQTSARVTGRRVLVSLEMTSL
jgi:hypothetical protein